MVVLQFHKLTHRSNVVDFTWHTPRAFASLVRWLRRHRLANATLADLAAEFEGRSGPPNRVLITFDDGYAGVYDYGFPILREFGYTAATFLVAGYVGRDNAWDAAGVIRRQRHLSWDQIAEMAQAGFQFGSHAMTHPDLTVVPEERLHWELAESKRRLEAHLGTVDFFSYPFGRLNRRVLDATRAAGYRYAVANFAHPSPGPFAIEKSVVHVIDLPASLGLKCGTSLSFFSWLERRKEFALTRFSYVTTFLRRKEYRKLPSELPREIAHRSSPI